jgi:acetyl coenzyme A synthetase (ADP forming)-like protein
MTNAVNPRYVFTPYQDAAESGRLILRDGSTAYVRLARPEDSAALSSFFDHCSPETRRRRFFSAARPGADLVAAHCDCSNPASALTLLVTRIRDGASVIVATGSYFAKDERTAEVAFAVDDAFHGKGLGTLLLERLALLAARHGFTRFWAVTHSDNRAMRDVFRESGFDAEERLEAGDIEVNLSVVPNEASVTRTDWRDRVATVASLRPFFRPRGVTVIGASRNPTSIGYRLLDALVRNGFAGPIYPVNPNAPEICGRRCFPSVRELPEEVDLAVIAVPRDAVLDVLDDCASRGVRAAVIISAGFAEVNAEGRELQRRLVDKARGHGMRIIGPNCLGILNADPAVRLNASFSPIFPPPGRIAMSSQSGALGLAILAAAKQFGLGLSTFVSVGNKADVSGNDLLQYWEEDEATDVILLYLESFGNPRRFSRIARRVSRRKPIVAIKSGRTKAGGRAAGSHTAALAASEVAVDALFHQTGVMRADTLEEMFDLAAALGSQPLPRGRRVAIITNAGGPAILCTDACEASGLVIPELSAATRRRLAEALPGSASTANPVDMIASATPEQYGQVIETILASGEADALVAIYIPVGQSQTDAFVAAVRGAVGRARAAGNKDTPVLACLMTEPGTWSAPDPSGEQIPTYAFPEAPARTLGKIAAYAEWRASPEGMIPDFQDIDLGTARETCRKALAVRGDGWLSSEETRVVLGAMCLPLAPGGVARSAQAACELAAQIGFPVAVKLASQKLVHKTDVGGVRLNLTSAEDVRDAFEEIRGRLEHINQLGAMDGVIVQPMIAGGIELMMGVTQDPLFGPLIGFGLGGVLVEVMADVVFRITPLTDRDAAEMVRGIRGYRLLQGYRGKPPADIEALEQALLRLSRLVEELPEISEIDLNPILAMPSGQGCRIVDARVRVRSKKGD